MLERTIAVCFAYDGAAFVGSQWQKQGRSVQKELETAWERLTGEQARLTFAGRTDAGVHALAQVAHVHTKTSHDLNTLVRALNVHTGREISIHEAWEVPATFHARFSARQRAYRYLIYNSPTPLAVINNRVTFIDQPLAVQAIEQALRQLVGEHDFAAFAGSGQAGSTVRVCTYAALEYTTILGVSCLAVVLHANAFLRHMVRNIVGTLIDIGMGRMQPEAISAILQSGNRRNAGPTARPEGLYLEWISYDPTVAPLQSSQRWDRRTYWRAHNAEV